MKKNNSKKIAIVGAGASGLMCACLLKAQHEIFVFDKNSEAGKKLLMTGKGRCNLTNLVDAKEFLNSVPQGNNFITHSINNFTPQDTVQFFNNTLGIETVLENSNRAFPKEGGASLVRDKLLQHAKNNGVVFNFNTKVDSIKKTDNGFLINVTCSDKQKDFLADAVIVATGGLSYPGSGSSGDGFKFAKVFNHSVTATRPSLCGLVLNQQIGSPGSSVFSSVQILDKNLKPVTNVEKSDLLFTELGVSGPSIFKSVASFKDTCIQEHILQIDFMARLDYVKAQNKFLLAFKKNYKRPIFNVYREFLPVNTANFLAEYACNKIKFNKAKPCSSMNSNDILHFLSVLKQFRVKIEDFKYIDVATVTRGGVDLKDVCDKTMQSKLVDNLYFIGEVLDVDGLSGGFNLQIAFSSAATCAKKLNA